MTVSLKREHLKESTFWETHCCIHMEHWVLGSWLNGIVAEKFAFKRENFQINTRKPTIQRHVCVRWKTDISVFLQIVIIFDNLYVSWANPATVAQSRCDNVVRTFDERPRNVVIRGCETLFFVDSQERRNNVRNSVTIQHYNIVPGIFRKTIQSSNKFGIVFRKENVYELSSAS